MALDIKPGDVVRLKKPHPCGGYLWKVNRVGGDVGLLCQTCGHHIMVSRFRIERRLRAVTRPAPASSAASPESPAS